MKQELAVLSTELQGKLGEPIAVLCMRYWYRGILSKIGEDFIILEQAHAVEQTGPASQDHPSVEDAIPSSVIIKLMAIEIICQPAWVWAGFKKNK